ncbi:MAG: hypothetical protein M3203_08255 [Actinomycetota bacterium]|nr:hypothetical protein [Actinomycetota bacterium]
MLTAAGERTSEVVVVGGDCTPVVDVVNEVDEVEVDEVDDEETVDGVVVDGGTTVVVVAGSEVMGADVVVVGWP